MGLAAPSRADAHRFKALISPARSDPPGAAAGATPHRAGAAVPTPGRWPTPATSIQQARRELARQKRVEEEDRLGLWALVGRDDAEE